MAHQVIMPQMGESVAEGTIVRWLKKVGDTVERDEPIFEITTDKVDAEIPAPEAGVLLEIRVHEGETVEVGVVVALLGEESEATASAPTSSPEPTPATAEAPATAGVAFDVIMPQMGESVAEGTIVRWLKKVGDTVERDEPIFEITTDKVDAEIPAPEGGVLLAILTGEGETVEVGVTVARIGELGAVAAPAAAPTTASVSASAPVSAPAADRASRIQRSR